MAETDSSPSVRYMDFVGRRRSASTDPLVSQPSLKPAAPAKASVPVKPAASSSRLAVKPAPAPLTKRVTPKPVVRPLAAAPVPPVSSSRSVPVSKTSDRPLVARKPSSAPRELFPTTKPSKTTDKPVDATAKKAAAALSGSNLGKTSLDSKKSPFLPSYSIDKRPLSSSIPEKKTKNYEKVSYLGVSGSSSLSSAGVKSLENSSAPKSKSLETLELAKNSPKNSRKSLKSSKKSNTSSDSLVIDGLDEKKGLPLPVVIFITILLGAAVGAGIYFLLPK